jgi:hypothetical protein
MDDSKPQEPVYSKERLQLSCVDSPAETSEAANPAANEPPQATRMAALSGALQTAWDSRDTALADLTAYLKRTWRLWLAVAAVVFGMMGTVTLAERASDWAKNRRERRHELAVATVTPEHLIARCGAATEDVTKEVFPIVMRTMSYQGEGNRKLVVAFSRTAEEKSDWVFLSMNDVNGGVSYESPDAKIDALPCLDSTR